MLYYINFIRGVYISCEKLNNIYNQLQNKLTSIFILLRIYVILVNINIIIINKEMIDSNPYLQNRQISSSQSCHCKYCVIEAESIKGNKRIMYSQYFNNNLKSKKRRGPPIKKECCLFKEGSHEAKYQPKKFNQFRPFIIPQNQDKKATPAKNRPLQQNKVCFNNVILDSYHAVSISQREKLVRQNLGSRQLGNLQPVYEGRNVMNHRAFGRSKAISNYEQIEDRQNLSIAGQAARSSSYQASPSINSKSIRSKSNNGHKHWSLDYQY